MHICLTIIHPTDNSNVHWTYAYSIGSNEQLLCPLDISMSIRSNGQLKCPLDIRLSNGSIGSNGPLDILPLPSHRPATCMGSMYANVQWTYEMFIGHMTVHWIQWTTQMSIGHGLVHWIQWTTEMSIGHMHVQWIHWIQWTIGHTPFAISQACLPVWGRCPHMTLLS